MEGDQASYSQLKKQTAENRCIHKVPHTDQDAGENSVLISVGSLVLH